MNIFNAPHPGTTLRTITEEWKVLSGFHTLMRERMKLEAEHLVQLRRLQNSLDPDWSKSGSWTLISPIVELWSSQMDIMEKCSEVLSATLEACPTEPSPDEPEEGALPSSRYVLLHGSYKAYQDCQTAASSREAIAEMREWFEENHNYILFVTPLPITDRNYRESVVAQRSALGTIAKWHSTKLPEKLEAHVQYAEGMQTCLTDYLVESSKFTSDLVKSISSAQKTLAEFSSLSFIDPHQRCFEYESSHPAFQPAVYLSHYLGGVPAHPVLGVLSYLPKLIEIRSNDRPHLEGLLVKNILEVEKESTYVDEITQKLKERYNIMQWYVPELALSAIGPLLPIGDDAIRQYKNGIKRDEIAQLLKPFPIENCRMAFTIMARMDPSQYIFIFLHGYILGSRDAKQLFEDIWRKWDFDNHRPLPPDVVRTMLEWKVRTKKVESGRLIIKKTGLPYKPLQ